MKISLKMINDFSYLTPGKLLKKTRKEKKLNIEHVAQSIKIRKDSLIAIENDDYSVFESDVYTKGFIKLYARFLGLDQENIMALYRRYVGVDEKNVKVNLQESFNNEKRKKFNLVITSKTLVVGAVATLILSIFIYLFLQIYYYQKPPNLQISSPSEEYIETSNRTVTVTGYTDIGATVFVDDTVINVDENGYFETDVSLRIGDNVILVKAVFQDTVGRENVKKIVVLRDDDNTVSQEVVVEEDEEEDEYFNLKVSIEGGEAWIELYVDDEIIISRIVQDGFVYDKEVYENMRITTGFPSRTKVFINEEEVALTIGNGVGSLDCNFKNGNISCN